MVSRCCAAPFGQAQALQAVGGGQSVGDRLAHLGADPLDQADVLARPGKRRQQAGKVADAGEDAAAGDDEATEQRGRALQRHPLDEQPDPLAGFDDQRVGLGDLQDGPSARRRSAPCGP